MQVQVPLTKMTIHLHYEQNKKQVGHEVFEGEVEMSQQQQQDYYSGVVGDANASVTVSREMSESSYGNGGKVFISVTLTCGQSQPQIEYAVSLATGLVNHKINEAHDEFRKQLQSRGIIQ